MSDSRSPVLPLPDRRREGRREWRPQLLRLRGAVGDDAAELASKLAITGGKRLHDLLPDEPGRRIREQCRCLTCR